MKPSRPSNWSLLLLILLPVLAFSSCDNGSSGGGGRRVLQGQITGAGGQVLAGATVYLIPAGDVDETPFDGQDILDGSAEDRDEPLEDLVRTQGASYTQAVVDAGGFYRFTGVAAGDFFVFVMPAAGDLEHLPGGAACRVARNADTFLSGFPLDIELSSSPRSTATYIGTSTCLACHPSYSGVAHLAHKLGFRVPGVDAPLQNRSFFPDFDDGLLYFMPGTAYTVGTEVWFSDFDAQRSGYDKFKTSLSDPSGLGETVYVKAWLWYDSIAAKYKITLENIINNNPTTPLVTFTVALTYGGALQQQRYVVSVAGRNGRYPLLQFQHEGSELNYERTRRVFRDYNLASFWDDNTQEFVDPPADQTVEGSCMACHATGYTTTQDQGTGEWLCDAVNDVAGVIDIDGDGANDEINTGCESCHGPGSDHIQNPSGGRWIVQPQYLSPSREMMICGSCHDRVLGHGSQANGQPLDATDRMPLPGISRAEYLANHVTRKGPATSDYWSDLHHSRHHYQQYTELLRSVKHRNDRKLVTCSGCHDMHGSSSYERGLVGDPEDPNSPLCMTCHNVNPLVHMQNQTGATHAGLQTGCSDCHMAPTAQSGAGRTGLLLGVPTGTVADDDLIYYHNDIASHLFGTIPKKTHPDVRGDQPTHAMPIPYTNSCGAPCHDASQLPHQLK